MNDLLEGPNQKTYAVQWLGSPADRDAIAKRVSPMTYVRAGLPPVLAIHGDADPTVPYQQSVKMLAALSKVDVANQLVTIPGGKHGGFTADERTKIYLVIHEFLAKHGLGTN